MRNRHQEAKQFQTHFRAREYLRHYYAAVDIAAIRRYVHQKSPAAENAGIMIHLAEFARPIIRGVFGVAKPTLLEVGGGPTVNQLLSVAPLVRSIHFTDFLHENLEEVRRWKNGERTAFNWRPYTRAALMLERDSPLIREADAERREYELRRKITRFARCDIFEPSLLLNESRYGIVSTHFVAESATSSRVAWGRAIQNICRKVAPRGLLIMSALLGARGSYRVAGKRFPAVRLSPRDIRQVLSRHGFRPVFLDTTVTEDRTNNYRGFIFIIAMRR